MGVSAPSLHRESTDSLIWFLLLLPLPHYIPDAGENPTNTSQDNISVSNRILSRITYSERSLSNLDSIWKLIKKLPCAQNGVLIGGVATTALP